MAVSTIGQRDLYVQIQSRPAADTDGGSGFPTDGLFTDFGNKVPMARRSLSAREKFAAGTVQASGDDQWEFGYLSTMDPDEYDVPKLRRLVYKNRIYDIQSAEVLTFDDGKAIRLVTLARSGS